MKTIFLMLTCLSLRAQTPDYYKAAGVTYFGLNMAGMLTASNMGMDYKFYKNAALGFGAGVTTNILVYKATKNKGFATFMGILSGFAVGAIKNRIDKRIGCETSTNNIAYMGAGSAWGSIGATIVIGHKEKAKRQFEL